MKMKRGIVWLLSCVMVFSCLLQFSVPKVKADNIKLRWPVPGHCHISRNFTSGYGGIDISDQNIDGAPVVAAADGAIWYVKKCSQHHPTWQDCVRCDGWGTEVLLHADTGLWYTYAYLKGNSVPSYLKSGTRVRAGDVIGKVGMTGYAAKPSLYFAISTNGRPDETGFETVANKNHYMDFDVTWISGTVDLMPGNAVITKSMRFAIPSTVSAIDVEISKNQTIIKNVRKQINKTDISDLTVSYDMNKDFGIKLEPGAQYNCHFYVILNGQQGSTSSSNAFTAEACTNHNFGGWKVTTQATCKDTGVEKRVCSVCGKEETRIIPVTDNHVYSNAQDRNCNVCGKIRQISTQILDVYRLYNESSGEHLYCTDPREINMLATIGWKVEGIAWTSPAFGEEVYRLYNPNDGSHLYTRERTEINTCLSMGWTMDGPVCYTASVGNGRPIYRLFNRYASSHYHLYTINNAEIEYLKGYGWKLEGIAWYACR